MLKYLSARFQERGSIAALFTAIGASAVSALFVFAGHGDQQLGIVVSSGVWAVSLLVLLLPEFQEVYAEGVDDLHYIINDIGLSVDATEANLSAVISRIEALPSKIVDALAGAGVAPSPATANVAALTTTAIAPLTTTQVAALTPAATAAPVEAAPTPVAG